MKKILSLIACAGLIITTGISTMACTNVTKDQFSKIKGAIYDDENNIILLPSEMQKLADSFGKDLIDENDDSRSLYWAKFRWDDDIKIIGNVIIGTLQQSQSHDDWTTALTSKWLITPKRFNSIKKPIQINLDFSKVSF